jgi:hypothetical protein
MQWSSNLASDYVKKSNSHVWFAFSLRKIPPALAGKFCIRSRKSDCTMRCIFSRLRSAITSSASCILHSFEQTLLQSLPSDDSTNNTGWDAYNSTLQGHSVDPLEISANNMLERLAVTNSPCKGRCFYVMSCRQSYAGIVTCHPLPGILDCGAHLTDALAAMPCTHQVLQRHGARSERAVARSEKGRGGLKRYGIRNACSPLGQGLLPVGRPSNSLVPLPPCTWVVSSVQPLW